MTLAYRARYVFTANGPPLPDAAVNVDGQRIVSVGSAEAELRDLGNVALVPGLVNAHTHLEFSSLPAPLGEAGMGFADWVRQIISWRRRLAVDSRDLGQSRLRAVSLGLAESCRSGVKALGEIATPPFAPQPFDASPIEGTVFLELLGLAAEQRVQLLDLAREHLAVKNRFARGLSPHAPYTVGPGLLQQLVQLARQADAPLAMHLAETVAERELMESHTGPFVELLSQLDAWHPAQLPAGTAPLDYLRLLPAAPRALVVHGNYLTPEEISFLGHHRRKMSAVYCPRTHAYFGHRSYPLAEMLAAGVNVAVGTDSRASNPDLAVWEELRWIAQHQAHVDPADVLRLGTINGARALGCHARRGTLEPGKLADFLIVPLAGDSQDPYELLFESSPQEVI